MTDITDQPPPTHRPDLVPVWEAVVRDFVRSHEGWLAGTMGDACKATASNVVGDMRERDRVGRERYGTPLTTGNGRDHLVDAYQELLDAAVYLKAALLEGHHTTVVYDVLLELVGDVRAMIDARSTGDTTAARSPTSRDGVSMVDGCAEPDIPRPQELPGDDGRAAVASWSRTNRKPSDVDLTSSFPPLVGTMGRTEREVAAAWLVCTCHRHGDAWQDCNQRMLRETLMADVADKREPLCSLSRNPFARPDLYDLVAAGYAEWSQPGQIGGALRFTQKGLGALRFRVAGGEDVPE